MERRRKDRAKGDARLLVGELRGRKVRREGVPCGGSEELQEAALEMPNAGVH